MGVYTRSIPLQLEHWQTGETKSTTNQVMCMNERSANETNVVLESPLPKKLSRLAIW